MKKLLFFFLFPCSAVFAQPTVYTTGNAHSHNDYQQQQPFQNAYALQYGSIEVDLYLSNNELLVAHTARDLPDHRTLEDLYLKPLLTYIQANKGYPYADTSRKLMLMFDVKTEGIPTINKLIDILIKYPQITHCSSVKILVTGNKPDPSTYASYPSFLWFDGLLSTHHSKESLTHIAMLSDNFINYSSWKGTGPIPEKEWETLKKAVEKAHSEGKKVRFWNAPDFVEGWEKMIELGVDYINTDSIKALAQYLKTNGVRKTS